MPMQAQQFHNRALRALTEDPLFCSPPDNRGRAFRRRAQALDPERNHVLDSAGSVTGSYETQH